MSTMLPLFVVCIVLPLIVHSDEACQKSVFVNDTRRIVAVGDIHGAWDNFKEIAMKLQLINDREEWIAEDTIFVQVGDLIHRREQNVKVVEKLFEYVEVAPLHNSEVLIVCGNHDYEQMKWNPANKGAFVSQQSWYMPDFELFYEKGLNEKLRKLQLIYSVNGFVFVHAGIERKHLEAANTANIEEINELMAVYLKRVTFANQNDLEFAVQRKVASMVWLQWLHDYKRSNIQFCDKVHEVLDLLHAHTMVVGHYFPSSQQSIFSECDQSIIFTDVGFWYNYMDALIIKNETISTVSGKILENSVRRKAILTQQRAEGEDRDKEEL